MALDFTGSTRRLDCGSGASLDNLDIGTRLVWAYPTDVTATPPPHFMDKRGAGSTWRAFYMNTAVSAGQLAFQVARATAGLNARSAAGFVTVNEWQCLAAVYNVNGVDGDQRLYRGTLVSTLAEAPSYVTQSVGNGASGDDSAGTQTVGNVTGIDNFNLDGLIAVVGIWNRVLSLNELIAQQYRPRMTDGCVLLMHVGYHGTGTQVDYSGNGNHGTVTGATLADHVPLGPPFGWVSGWRGAFKRGTILRQMMAHEAA